MPYDMKKAQTRKSRFFARTLKKEFSATMEDICRGKTFLENNENQLLGDMEEYLRMTSEMPMDDAMEYFFCEERIAEMLAKSASINDPAARQKFRSLVIDIANRHRGDALEKLHEDGLEKNNAHGKKKKHPSLLDALKGDIKPGFFPEM